MKFWIDKDGFIYLFQVLKACGAIPDYKEVSLAIKNGQVLVNDETCFKNRQVLKAGDTVRYQHRVRIDDKISIEKYHLIITEKDELGRTDEEKLRETKPEGSVRHGRSTSWTNKPLEREIQIDREIVQISRKLHEKLLLSHKTISFAESCTGGLVQKTITDNSGASAYFLGGVVCYSDSSKNKVLKINRKILETHGAVSKEVAVEMVKAGYLLFGSDICGAITGIAGPGGGTREKPVGLVHIAISMDFNVVHQEFNLRGDRELIRKKTVLSLFKMILDNM